MRPGLDREEADCPTAHAYLHDAELCLSLAVELAGDASNYVQSTKSFYLCRGYVTHRQHTTLIKIVEAAMGLANRAKEFREHLRLESQPTMTIEGGVEDHNRIYKLEQEVAVLHARIRKLERRRR